MRVASFAAASWRRSERETVLRLLVIPAAVDAFGGAFVVGGAGASSSEDSSEEDEFSSWTAFPGR